MLEKAPRLGGTAAKAAFWYWVPNNRPMRELGLDDPKDDCLRYMARLARPQRYDPAAPRFGLTEWEYAMCEAIYDGASPATELLAERGPCPTGTAPPRPTTGASCPRTRPHRPGAGALRRPRDHVGRGAVAIRTLSAAAERDGVEVRTGHRVQRVVRDEGGRVTGVEATTDDGAAVRSRPPRRSCSPPAASPTTRSCARTSSACPYGGCAAASNEGDFVYIAGALGAQLRNMNYAWMCPVSLEKAVARDPAMSGMFSVAGDSMLWVDKRGRWSSTTSSPRPSSAGTRPPPSTPTWCWWPSGTSAARTTRPATSTAG